MYISMYPYQQEALTKMKNGCILNGGVGSGKSRTSIAYYYIQNGGQLNGRGMRNPQDLVIITTARKRDTNEWDEELATFGLSIDPDKNLYNNVIFVDSWNNIKKYETKCDAFFIFDEQRVVGRGAWVKSFLKIAKNNKWILLSATPGDTWSDYIPVFIANGFYKNRSEFARNHIVYSRFTQYPKIDRYLDTGRLIRLRNSILVNMDYRKKTVSHHEDIFVDYDIDDYKQTMKMRWSYIHNKPLETASELCIELRRIVNSDRSRQDAVLRLVRSKHKAVIFYNYDYELEILKGLNYGSDYEIAEWNGHKHQPLPTCDNWVYLVQYNAGNEGWNCVTTDTIIFYSSNYSYKIMVQAAGRIDRLNTPYTDLYYYHLKSRSSIDLAITRALKNKKQFNERQFTDGN